MIKYFKELEKPNNFKINIMPYNIFKHNKLPIKFYLKYCKILKEILFHVNAKMIHRNEYKEIVFPNAWYILPKFNSFEEHLYNAGGESGHKDTDLINSYNSALEGILINPNYFSLKLKKSEKDEKILNDYIKSCNGENILENLLTIFVGNTMAEGLLWNYFDNLKQKNQCYPIALEKLNKMLLDDFLVRCVGFHKIISVEEKVISTSDINYQKDFSEYLNNGWTVDFVKPLVWSNSKNDFVEIDNDMVKIKQFHI